MNVAASERELGASVTAEGMYFRVWAPRARRLEAVFEPGRAIELHREEDGCFSGWAPGARAGERYRFRIDGVRLFPDPCSRFQPEGPHGPSEVVDPRAFRWTDEAWPGISIEGAVFYELHVGCFTRGGTFDSAIARLDALKDLGVTALEIMPIGEFPGKRNWGYDGVGLYAPYHGYGGPEAFRRFVDAAHARSLGVVLDVVYNHFGPDGNYLKEFSTDYFTNRHKTDWGEAVNFDGPGSAQVREFFLRNAEYWISEFHLDGLRLDATQNIYDSSEPHILAEITRRARAAAGGRSIVLVGENEPQDVKLVRPIDEGGFGLDALWIDDFHHAARVALTGRRDAYFTDYTGVPQEFVSLAGQGPLFQGQYYRWQKQPRGTPSKGEPARSFVFFLQNHDQIANSLDGRRLNELVSPAEYRALTALLLLGPETPLLFMGQEMGSRAPFAFFVDHNETLAPLVREGRKEFLSQFDSLKDPSVLARVPDPSDPRTFEAACIDTAPPDAASWLALHRDLLKIRRTDPAISRQDRFGCDGAVLAERAFAMRFSGENEADDRLLIVNLGFESELDVIPVPILAPPSGFQWSPLWESEHPKYGGAGAISPILPGDRGFLLPPRGATLLAPRRSQRRARA